MDAIAPGGSCVWEYSREGVAVLPTPDVQEAQGRIAEVEPEKRMTPGEFLADHFLICRTGLPGLRYDAKREILFNPLYPYFRPIGFLTRIPHHVRVQVRGANLPFRSGSAGEEVKEPGPMV